MEIDNSIIAIIDLLGFLQGLILGSILLYLGIKKKRSTFFLGLFVLVSAYGFLPVHINDQGFSPYHRLLANLPRVSEWWLMPLFFLYVLDISILERQKKYNYLLIPGFLILAVQLLHPFLESETADQNSNVSFIRAFILPGLFFSFLMVFVIHWTISKHLIEVKNQYASLRHRELKWAKLFNLFAGITLMLHFIYSFLTGSVLYKTFFSIANVFMLYWASIHGIIQQNIQSVIKSDGLYANLKSDQEEEEIPNEQLEKLVRRIDGYMKDSGEFTKKNLTISNVSEKLNIHPKQFSRAINVICQENFNAYINRYRVEKAEEMLIDKEATNLSIEGIGLEVGFQSKSAFYTAFKKINGTTPNRYREKLIS